MDLGRRSLRVFISSPDDVKDEREACRRVIARIAREFRHEFALEAVMWEWKPLLADAHFQSQIPAPRDTDITVVILWSRLGTYLPEDRFPGPVSGARVTGTEWEFEDALAARRAQNVPDILVFRKQDAELSLPASTHALDEQRESLRLVEKFFERWFRARPDGNVDIALRAFRASTEFESIFEEHLRELLKRRLGSTGRVISWHSGSPYRGLLAFEPEHAEVFFGRGKAARSLRTQLERRVAEQTPFLVVLGASGSGKSSFVKASLVPLMQAGAWVAGIGVCRYAALRPGDDEHDPLAAIARALLQPSALPELKESGFEDANALYRLLSESPASAASAIAGALRVAASRVPPRAHQRAAILIAVDQLEELFTNAFEDAVREGFVRVLDSLSRTCAEAAETSNGPLIIVVATLRSDFYGHIDRIPTLARLIQGEGQFLLLPPAEDEIAEMIRLPAQLAGLSFERDEERGTGLDEQILAVARRDTRVLPMLSFLLDQLWQLRTDDGRLTFAAYEELGGLEGSLARCAEELLVALPEEVGAALPTVLGALVSAASSDLAVEGSNASFTARWLAIDRFSKGSPERRLIDALLAPDIRLLVADADRGEIRVRVAHEALFSHWKRAQTLLEKDRKDLILIDRLSASERLWRTSKAPDRLLPAGLPMAEGVDLVARRSRSLAPDIVEYIKSSQELESLRRRKRKQWARQLMTLFATIALVASVLGVVAWRKGIEAREQGAVATSRADKIRELADGVIFDQLDRLERISGTFTLRVQLIHQAQQFMAEIRSEVGTRKGLEGSYIAALNQLGRAQSAAGRTSDALKTVLEGLAISRQLTRADPEDLQTRETLAVSLENVGDLRLRSGELVEAQKCYGESLEIFRQLARAAPNDVRTQSAYSVSLQKVGNVRLQSGEMEAAQACFEESLEILRLLAGADPTDAEVQRSLSFSLNKVGSVRLRFGEREQAQKCFEESIDIRRRLVAAASNDAQAQRDYSVSLELLGDAHLRSGEREEALKSFQESLEIRRRLAGADPSNTEAQRDFSMSLGKVGQESLRAGALEEAQKYFQESLDLDLLLARADPSDARAQLDHSISLEQVGNVRLRAGERKGALKCFQESLEIRRRLAETDPNDTEVQGAYSTSLEKVGDVRLESGEREEALKSFQESLEIRRRLAGADPSNTEAQRSYHVSLNKVGNVRLQSGESEEAQKCYEESLKITRLLAKADPNDARAQRDYLVGLNKVGSVQLQSGKREEAQKCYQESLKISKRLAEADPKNTEAQRDYSISLENVGNILVQSEDREAALKCYQESLDVSRQLAEASPQDAQAQRDCSSGLLKIGDLRLQSGDEKEALRCYQENRDICQRLAAANMDDVHAQGAYSFSLERVGDAHLQARDLDRALECYQESLDVSRRLATASPKDAQARRNCSFGLEKVGGVRLQTGDREGALMCFQESQKIRISLEDWAGCLADIRQELIIARQLASLAKSDTTALEKLRGVVTALENLLSTQQLQLDSIESLQGISDAIREVAAGDPAGEELRRARAKVHTVIERIKGETNGDKR